jgi:hypothetical protein
MKGATAKFYASHPEARKKRLEYQAEYNKRADQLKKRIELNRENRKRGTYSDETGPHAGKDLSHHKNGKFTYESPSKNRGDKNNMPGDARARGTKKKK